MNKTYRFQYNVLRRSAKQSITIRIYGLNRKHDYETLYSTELLGCVKQHPLHVDLIVLVCRLKKRKISEFVNNIVRKTKNYV